HGGGHFASSDNGTKVKSLWLVCSLPLAEYQKVPSSHPQLKVSSFSSQLNQISAKIHSSSYLYKYNQFGLHQNRH
ncbi:MAG: hypothetical protein JSV50_23055, partial [Desulfobacteraceae bacterium]